MRLRIPCPNPACAIMFAVAEGLRGKRVRCPRCRTAFSVPAEGVELVASGAMPVAVANLPATIGRYQVRARLGAGAYGTVYRAYDPQLDRELAVKLLKPESLASPQAVERFQREARANARMMHPNIVPVFDAGRHEESYYIASAFIDGPSLADVVPEAGLDLRRAAALTVQLADALAAAHKQGVLHRDVKPANILLDAADHLYLTDFGLAGWMQQEHTQLTQEGAVLGTPAYMAPEQAAGDTRQVGPASDLYSAGVVLYQLLTGQPPFQGPAVAVVYHILNSVPSPPGQLRAGLDPALAAICTRAMARRPEDRYPGCQEFAAALRGWLAGQPSLLDVPDAPATGQGTPRRRTSRVDVPLPTQSNAAPGQETCLPVPPPAPVSLPPKRPAAASGPDIITVQPLDDPELIGVRPVRKKPPRPPPSEEEDVARPPRPLYVLLWTVLFLGGGVGLAAGGVAALLYFLNSRPRAEQAVDPVARHEAIRKETIQQLNEAAKVLESVTDTPSANAAAVKINKVCDRLAALEKEDAALPKLNPPGMFDLDSAARRAQSAALQAQWKFKEPPRDFTTALQRLRDACQRFQTSVRKEK